jgi:hypothetical protein
MNLDYCLAELTRNAAAIQHLVEGVDADQARWKPNPESWSILEVICHLADEERADFRTRVRFVLSGTEGDPPPIDPQGWVTDRGYNERDLGESLRDFLRERQDSLAWLRGLSDPNWDSAYTASWGTILAGDLMVAWVAHDLLHVRQLVELKWVYGAGQFAPYNQGYAGDW